jgi:acetylglutamate kinase
MIPKVRTALHAVDLGIPQAKITNLAGLTSADGTVFHSGSSAIPVFWPQREAVSVHAGV